MTADDAVFEVARLATSPEQADELQSRLDRASALFRAGGALDFQALRGVEEPFRFQLLIKWPSLDAHAAFRATSLRTQWRELIDPIVTEGPAGAHFVRVVGAADDRATPTR